MTRRSVLPLALVLANLGAYAAFVFTAPTDLKGDVHPVALLLAGAKVSSLVESGEWWRLFSSVFLHADSTHLIVNCIGTYFLAQVADNVFGWVRTMLLYVIGGATGALVSTFFSEGASVGASGAVYSLLGAILVFGIVQRNRIPRPLQRILLTGTVIWIVISLLYTADPETVDNASHMGGMAAGVILGLLFGGNLPVFGAGAPTRTPMVWRVFATLCGLVLAISAGMSVRGLALDFEMPVPDLAEVTVNGVAIPYPTKWRPGRLSGSCKRDDNSSITDILSDGAACFQDPYGSTFVIGRSEDVASGIVLDSSMTLENGLRTPICTRDGDITKRLLMLNNNWAVAFVSYEILSTRYEPFIGTVIDGVEITPRS